MYQSITIRHNVEMGHRLSLQPDSKCFHLHGHSWWIDLTLFGEPDDTGMIIEFATVKTLWRTYLDQYFDHHMCLNESDPMFNQLFVFKSRANDDIIQVRSTDLIEKWGFRLIDCDPTVENMARIWGEAAVDMFSVIAELTEVKIDVQEAATNKASWSRTAQDGPLRR